MNKEDKDLSSNTPSEESSLGKKLLFGSAALFALGAFFPVLRNPFLNVAVTAVSVAAHENSKKKK